MSKKRVICLFVMLLFVASCSTPRERLRVAKVDLWMQENGKVKVLATTEMLAALVRMVGRDRVDCLSLFVGDVDPHRYELVKGDREKLDRAELLVSNGLHLECGASLRYALETSGKTLFLGDAIAAHHSELLIEQDGVIDPHIWMDVGLFALGIDPLVDFLIRKDPEGEEAYRKSGKEAKKKLQDFDQFLREKMQAAPSDRRFLVTSHDAFHYFTRKYLAEEGEVDWEKRRLAPEGLVPNGELGALDLQKVCDFLCSHHQEVVFSESNCNQASLKKIIAICKEQGLAVELASVPLYGDAMGEMGEEENGYFRMLEHNIDTLVHFWGRGE